MLAAEGQMHKRQRRVATPAFSVQTMRALVPLVFRKGTVLKEKWTSMIADADDKQGDALLIDVCRWSSRATFDVMGTVGELVVRLMRECITDTIQDSTMSSTLSRRKITNCSKRTSTCSRWP